LQAYDGIEAGYGLEERRESAARSHGKRSSRKMLTKVGYGRQCHGGISQPVWREDDDARIGRLKAQGSGLQG
jgi:hypothetical protein